MQKLGVSSISFLKSNRGRVVKISDDEFIYSPFPNTPRFLPGSGVCMRSIHAKNSSHDTERLQATHGDQLIQPPLPSLLSNILELRHDMNTRRTCKTVSCFPITNLARIKIVAERSRSIETRRVNNHSPNTFLKIKLSSLPPALPTFNTNFKNTFYGLLWNATYTKIAILSFICSSTALNESTQIFSKRLIFRIFKDTDDKIIYAHRKEDHNPERCVHIRV